MDFKKILLNHFLYIFLSLFIIQSSTAANEADGVNKRIKKIPFTVETKNFITTGVLVTPAVPQKDTTYIIFIPGLLKDEEISIKFSEKLLRSDNYSVFVVDYLGWRGTKKKGEIKNYLKDYIQWVNELIRAFNLRYGKPIVITHSIAGIGLNKAISEYPNLPIVARIWISPVGAFNNKLAPPVSLLYRLRGLIKKIPLPIARLLKKEGGIKALRQDKQNIVALILAQCTVEGKRLSPDSFVRLEEFNTDIPYLFIIGINDKLSYPDKLKKLFPYTPIKGGHHIQLKSIKAIKEFIKKLKRHQSPL